MTFLKFLNSSIISRPILFLRRHLRLVSASVVFAIGLMMVSAFSVSLIPAPRHIAYVESFPLHLSIELEGQEFSVGENITIRLVLKNLSNGSVSLMYPELLWSEDGITFYHIGVGLYANGTRWAIRSDSGALATCSFVLSPFEEIAETMIWDQKLFSTFPISIGAYNLTATISPGHSWVCVNGVYFWDGLETDPLPIIIK